MFSGAHAVCWMVVFAIRLGGVIEEGAIDPIFARSEAAARELLELRIRDYAVGKTGTVYWRTEPETACAVVYEQDWTRGPTADGDGHDYFPLQPVPVWRGRARLLISDKSVVAEVAA